jgi:hypothetical protein
MSRTNTIIFKGSTTSHSLREVLTETVIPHTAELSSSV